MVYVHDHLPHASLTGSILKCCFEVMHELGAGFLESVYKSALTIAVRQCGLSVDVERSFDVHFRHQKVGLYVADLVVENTVIVELKCCKSLCPEHLAQTINYLVVADLPIGIRV
jgi:GxxExxY protein